MAITCDIVSKESIPNNRWTKLLKEKVALMRDNQALCISVNKKQSVSGILTAWYRIPRKFGSATKSKSLTHELGTTIWLWWE